MTTENLEQIGARLSKLMADSDVGPNFAACEVMALASNWDSFREESDGLSVSGWLKRVGFAAGRNESWFKRRYQGLVALGYSPKANSAVRKNIHHDVVCRIGGMRLDPVHLDEIKRELICGYQATGAPLTPNQADPIIARVVGKNPRQPSAKDRRIQELEAIVLEKDREIAEKDREIAALRGGRQQHRSHKDVPGRALDANPGGLL